MSKANGAIEKKDTFLQHVSLKNYITIQDVEIDFKPGLNIIIGKNGSGKTIFLNYLYWVVDINWDQIANSLDAEFTLVKAEDVYRVKAKSEFTKNISSITKDSLKRINSEFFINDVKQMVKNDDEHSLVYPKFLGYWLNQSIIYYIKLLKHGIPHDQEIVELPKNFAVYHHNIILEIKQETFFLKSLFVKLEHEFSRARALNEITARNIIDELTNYFFRDINDALTTFTDIGGIRISPNFNLYSSGGKNVQKIDVHNFFLEFLVNGEWLPYYALSDGSKRLFYIISEILCHNKFEIIIPPESSADYGDLKSPAYIVLLEEPELGIHPHQLHQLMQFIKEQSREKQIILTTHSPQVLDVLGPDELDRVIICHYDSKNGTQLSHLSEKEINKAKKYMKEEAFLSDYWRFSDLEPAS
jgi:predicted ATP-dependent endonuclease of OLD family